MKKKYLIFEFLTVLVFLVLPPLFNFSSNSSPVETAGIFSINVVFQFLVSLALDFQHRSFFSSQKEVLNARIIKFCLYSTLSLGCLMAVYAIFETVSFLLPQFFSSSESYIYDENLTPLFWVFSVFNFFTAAYYEEVIYRQFLPYFTAALTGNRKYSDMASEVTALTLFSLSHVYLGFSAVLNALICGIILRLCMKKTGTVTAGTFAHFTYNFMLLLFYLFS